MLHIRSGLHLLPRAAGLALAALLGVTCARASAQVPYHFDITTSYQANPGNGSLDSGVLTIINNGCSTFTGTLGASGSAADGSTVSPQSGTLAPGATFTQVITGDSSNDGGWNEPNGITVELVGTVTLGASSQSVSLTTSDSQIHSGSFNTSPCDNISTDAFVLQGGSPTGCDNGDAYELSQAPGHFSFTNGITVTGASASPNVLWPPNNKLVLVTVNYSVVGCGTVNCTLSVSNNETGSADAVVVDAHHVLLRATRLGSGTGRIYTITIKCADGAGNTTSQTVTVTVPHDQGHG